MKWNLLLAGLVALIVVAGCKRRPDPPLKYVHGQTRAITNDNSAFDKGGTLGPITDGGRSKIPDITPAMPVIPVIPPVQDIPLAPRQDPDSVIQDRVTLAPNTVFFEFDRSTVKAGEKSKLDGVAKALKEKATAKLQIEGHCDERGTEEYNRSLGEKRALSLREYLIRAGIPAERVSTISFGEDKPAVPAHNEAAWAKNRRGEFILLLPK